MKIEILILTLALYPSLSYADLVLEAKATEAPYLVNITVINTGDQVVTFDYPSPERYPHFNTWSPFHWKIESEKPLPVKEGSIEPKQGVWSTTHVISSRAYIDDEWNALFDSKTLAPSEKVSYTGDIRKIMPFFDWEKAKGDVIVEFKFPGNWHKEKKTLVSKPIKITLENKSEQATPRKSSD